MKSYTLKRLQVALLLLASLYPLPALAKGGSHGHIAMNGSHHVSKYHKQAKIKKYKTKKAKAHWF